MAFEANVCSVWRLLISCQCTSGSNEEDEWVAEVPSVIYMEFSRRSKTWERIYGDFPSIMPFGGFVSEPNLAKEFRGKKRGTKNHLNRS